MVEVRTERIGGVAVSPLVAATVLDVTAVASAARTAKAARSAAKLEALQEASRKKDEFIGMLSHELRNPLAPIRYSTYILRQAQPGSEQARRAQLVIERQTEHLTRLVNDLLDVTRIARGKIEIRHDDVDLAEVVRRAAEDHLVTLQQRGLQFDVDVTSRAVHVVGDDARLTQAIGNLLFNAAKFTAEGGKVTVSLAPREGSAEIRVRDTGSGIASSSRSRRRSSPWRGARAGSGSASRS